jgi:hypothetical protein
MQFDRSNPQTPEQWAAEIRRRTCQLERLNLTLRRQLELAELLVPKAHRCHTRIIPVVKQKDLEAYYATLAEVFARRGSGLAEGGRRTKSSSLKVAGFHLPITGWIWVLVDTPVHTRRRTSPCNGHRSIHAINDRTALVAITNDVT